MPVTVSRRESRIGPELTVVIVNYNAEYGPDDPSNPNPNAGVTDVAHPIQRVGYEEGAWAMDLSLKVAHTFKIGKKLPR